MSALSLCVGVDLLSNPSFEHGQTRHTPDRGI
jgi:hypothetical protein